MFGVGGKLTFGPVFVFHNDNASVPTSSAKTSKIFLGDCACVPVAIAARTTSQPNIHRSERVRIEGHCFAGCAAGLTTAGVPLGRVV